MKRIFLLFLSVSVGWSAWACTSFIISGKVTPSGKPAMFKHRDTGELNNRIAYFQGDKYAFIGLVNSPMLDGEVWSGMNEAGFCIMNTASYNLREDSLNCQMDREGELMYHALANCATVADFEAWLTTYPQPWGVEANFGIIDAQGGAAYFEMNNSRYIKYDVNTMPNGYRVVTNFSQAGRYEEYEGWERYQTATAIMKEVFSSEKEMTAIDALNLFSRQYRHEMLDVKLDAENAPEYIVDQDFIPRRITSAVVYFEGVRPEGNPLHTVMWTALGYPVCAVAIPLLMDKKYLPEYMLARDANAKQGEGLHSEMCDASLKIKDEWAFPLKISNGKRYVNTHNILRGSDGKPSMLSCTETMEKNIVEDFMPLYTQWIQGKLNDKSFWQAYDEVAGKWMDKYYEIFQPYLTIEK